MKRGFRIVLIVAVLGLFPFMQASADVTTNINGEVRIRPEFRDNADFDKAADDTQSFYGQRLRLGFNARINTDLSGFIQLQDSRIWGTDDPVTDKSPEKVDVHQAYVVLNRICGLALDLKVGRQELMYGDSRLVGLNSWGNGRAFDAIKLMYIGDTVGVDIWTAKVMENNSCSGVVGCTAPVTGASGQDTDFYGIYSTVKENPIPESNLQGYILYKYDGPTNLSEYTVGARLAGKASGVGIDYTGEFAYQFGDKGNPVTSSAYRLVNISAYALAGEAGYTMANLIWSPRVAIEYDLATGDNDSTDKDYKTFDQLYPTNHAQYGYMDYQGWKNMKDVTLKVSVKPSDKSLLYAAYHMFSLAEENDSWYAADGTVKMPGGIGKGTVGQELDLLVRHIYNQNLKIEAGISEFFTGDFIKNQTNITDNENSTWAYIMGTVSF